MTEFSNPLLARIQFPGETFQIPSQGIFYNAGELDEFVENGEITVYPMTAIDELSMKSPDMMFSGQGIKEVFARCIPQVKDPGRLFTKDVDFLLICLRKVSYGDTVELSFNHHCQKDAEGNDVSKSHSYVANITSLIMESKRLDPTSEFTMTLPNEQKIIFSPIRFDDFVKLSQQSTERRDDEEMDIKQIEQNIIDVASSIILSVDEITNKDFIKEWMHGLPSPWVKKISKFIEKSADWGPNYVVKNKCRECGKTIEMEIPLNPLYFFT